MSDFFSNLLPFIIDTAHYVTHFIATTTLACKHARIAAFSYAKSALQVILGFFQTQIRERPYVTTVIVAGIILIPASGWAWQLAALLNNLEFGVMSVAPGECSFSLFHCRP
jgi:hypothetical protein